MNRTKKNKYDIFNDHVIFYTKNDYFIVDVEDFELVSNLSWYQNEDGYFYTLINKRKTFLHRIIMGVGYYKKNGIVIDHINHDIRNNKKENLRMATRRQNKMNGKLRKNNSSGIIGVGWYKKLQKYFSRISIDGVETHLGYFETLDEAITSRLSAERKYYQEFSPQKHLFEKYGII